MKNFLTHFLLESSVVIIWNWSAALVSGNGCFHWDCDIKQQNSGQQLSRLGLMLTDCAQLSASLKLVSHISLNARWVGWFTLLSRNYFAHTLFQYGHWLSKVWCKLVAIIFTELCSSSCLRNTCLVHIQSSQKPPVKCVGECNVHQAVHTLPQLCSQQTFCVGVYSVVSSI